MKTPHPMTPNTDLPPSLSSFAALLDAQPEPVRQAFNYCLTLMMVEAGEAGQVCIFPRRGPMGETVASEQFPIGSLRGSLARPALGHLCRAGRCRQEAEAEE
jgi:hypothetical protein